jgi:hypothetical protein
MKKNKKKYIDQFIEEALIYNRIDEKYENWFKSKHTGEIASSFHLFKYQMGEISIRWMK